MRSTTTTLRCCLFALMLASPARAQTQGLQTHLTFTQSTPLASDAELLRRIVTPIVAAPARNIAGLLQDVSHETFAVSVPPAKPAGGYGLLVFVPPWDNSKMPEGWQSSLDDHGMIFVSADESGNDKEVRTRRMPLALIAAANIMRQYPVDPSRVFVTGFSGGAQVALRLALAYPDVFRGAILNSGSELIGTADVPLPAADLFHEFQTRSRIVYTTGDLDLQPYSKERGSVASLASFCVAQVTEITMWNKAHETADEMTFSKALDALLAPVQPDSMADCRAKLDTEVQTQLHQVEILIAADDKAGAKTLLHDIDAKYGGLAAPKSLVLNAQLP
jgi:hypothetical protein